MPARAISGQTMIITGATSGIGRETVLAIANVGARVAVASRRLERLTELAAEIEGLRPSAKQQPSFGGNLYEPRTNE